MIDLFSGPAKSGNDHGLDTNSGSDEKPKPATKITAKTSLQPPQPVKAKNLTPCEVKTEQNPQPKTSARKENGHKKNSVSPEPLSKKPPLEKLLASNASVKLPSVTVPTEAVIKHTDNSTSDSATAANSSTVNRGGTDSGLGGQTGSGSPIETPMAYGSNPPPPYPSTARRRGWEGEVLLLVNVTATGEVGNVTVNRSSGYQVLDRAALNAIYRWQFQAAQRNGRAVAGKVMVPIRFDIKDLQ